VSKSQGYIVLKGKGKLELRTIEFNEGKKVIRTDELSLRKIKYAFHLKSEGFVQLTCLSGWFNVDDFYIKKTKPKSVVPQKMVEGLPNIFIFLIDGCQPSHLGIYGYFRKTSPFIDQFAKDAVIFNNAYANATFTRSSIATLFTGFYPQRHQLRIMVNKLSNDLFLLPEFLKEMGYRTSIYTEAGNIARRFGFTQGVDDYKKMFRRWDDSRYLKQNIPLYFHEWTETKGPIFSYIHFRAPHFPIIPPPPFLDMFKPDKKSSTRKRTILKINELLKVGHKFTTEEIADITADYDSTICYVDSQLGKLFQCLKEKKMYENSLIIFTSDHGEAIYEHGAMGHGNNVYDETSKVPLIVKFPKSMNLKGKVDTVVQLADIFPTISAMFGKTRDFDGRSLFDPIREKSLNDNLAISTTFNLTPEFGIRWRNWYYMIGLRDNSERLFNLKEDPLNEVSQTHPDVITFFRSKFITWLNQQNNLSVKSESVDLNKLPEDVKENLKSLGYLD
jgi:arylsulfatase A-like enzyme